ncbi:MAG: Npt1/Npt2 family nucleotide transporter [Longimicrobiales bacterium]|nr:Npt1/Npt2 family nucleotide transporter [Longimicrobiales bacterium]
MFAALAGLIQAGVMVGLTAADTLFLARVGFEKIPYVFIASPFVMVVYVPAFAFLISRFGTPRTMLFTLVALIAGGIGLFAAIPNVAQDDQGIGLIYYAARLYSELWYIALYTLFWNFTDTFFDIQDAKRLFPIFSAGSAAGAMVGGGIVAVVSQVTGLRALYLIWSLIALATLPVVSVIRKRYEVLEEGEYEPELGLIDQLRETAKALSRSRFVLILVCTLFAVVVLSSITEYEYLRIFSGPLNEEELGALLGRLLVFVNIFNLFFSLFLFNRLVLAVGVGTVALIQPLAYLAAFYFLLFQGGAAAAIFAFVAVQGILPSIEFNNQNFLFNAVPTGVKQQVRTAVEGMAEPAATALAGLLLLVLAEGFPFVRVAGIGFLLAGGYLAIAILLRSAYLPSLVENLRRGWLDLSRPASEALGGLGPDEKAHLRTIAAGGDGEMAHCALRLLSINDPDAAFEATLEYLPNTPDEKMATARSFIEALLQQAGPDTTRAFLDWVGQARNTRGPGFLEEMGGHGLIMPSEVKGLIDSHRPGEVAAAVIVLWHSWNPQDRLMASERLVRLLGGSVEEVAAGLRVIGRLEDESLASYAASHLFAESPNIRREAMATLRAVVTPDSAALVPDILRALPGADERSEYNGLEALGRIADPTCITRLLELAADFSPPVRRSVLRVLERMGLRSVPSSVAVFTDPRHRYAARAIAARFLGTAARPQLEVAWPGVIDVELERAYRYREFREGLGASPVSTSGIRVLRHFYRDAQERILDFILEILNIAGRLPSHEMLSSSLRSALPKERANALETVEQGVPRSLFKRLKPLLLGAGSAVANSEERNRKDLISTNAVLDAALVSPFAVEASAAADALWVEEHPEMLTRLRGRLPELHGQIFRETVVKLAADGQEVMTPVDIMDALAAAPFFEALTVADLQNIALRAIVEEVPAGTTLFSGDDPAKSVWVLIEGTGVCDGVPIEPGALLGDGALGILETYGSEVVSQGMTLVRVPTDMIMDLAEASSALGIELIRYASGAYGVGSL